MNLSPIILAILIVIVFICLYALIDRVCKCVEHCATAKSFTKAVEASEKVKTEKEEQ